LRQFPPSRIVCLTEETVETLYLLGEQDRIVGVYEVIVFKAEKDGTHLRPPPEGSAKIVFFTGVWHEPMNHRGGKKRRASGLGASAVTVKAR
jgi:hypothetical protein